MKIIFPLIPLFTTGIIIATTTAGFTQSVNNQIIDRNTAVSSVLDVRVIRGRATSIDFTLSDETIRSVVLADPSRTVYTSDVPITSGQAKIIYLRSIKELTFPGATRAYITNLTVSTADQTGKLRNYVFNLVPSASNNNYIGVRITSNPLVEPITFNGKSVTADDLETGLQRAVQYGYTPANDPVIRKVQRLIGLIRSGEPIRSAAQTTNVSIPVITALARISKQSPPTRSIP